MCFTAGSRADCRPYGKHVWGRGGASTGSTEGSGYCMLILKKLYSSVLFNITYLVYNLNKNIMTVQYLRVNVFPVGPVAVGFKNKDIKKVTIIILWPVE